MSEDAISFVEEIFASDEEQPNKNEMG